MPREVNLLGFSISTLSLILESLKSVQFSGKLRIIKNVAADEQIAYNPGFPIEEYHLQELKPFPQVGLFFATFKTSVKKAIFIDFENKVGIQKSQFINLFHSQSVLASTVSLSTGIYLEPGVILSPFSSIGFGVSINRGATIGHHTQIDAFASVNPGVHIAGHCSIGAGATVGMGAVIFDHVSIGPNSIIGGGSLVTKDIPADVLAYGNPCKVIKKL